MSRAPTALIADDEPLLREHLAALLGRLWPELEVVAQARNGREAVELFERHAPDVVFLDIHMPGVNGVEAARAIGRRAQVVFVTAYDQYAVQAFEQGAIDYVIKPFDAQRLEDTVQRLRERFERAPAPAAGSAPGGAALDPAVDALLGRLSARLHELAQGRPAWLQWIKASVGNSVRLIPVEQVHYLRSDEKYTLVAWEGGEALIRRSIRELADELDPQRFVQIHRSTIVTLHQVHQVSRGPNETAEVPLKGRSELLSVSRSYLHLFRQM